MIFKVPSIHSFVDVITNSSSVIFTYSESAVKPAKEMFGEVLRIMGEDKNVDGVFEFYVVLGNLDELEDRFVDFIENTTIADTPRLEEYNELCEKEYKNYKDRHKEILNIFFENTKNGNIEEWMEIGEEDATELYIVTKDEKYNTLVEKAISFLYSPNHTSEYDG